MATRRFTGMRMSGAGRRVCSRNVRLRRAAMSELTLSGEPAEIPDWFTKTRLQLFESWTKTTRHGLKRPTNGWACEIGYGCRTCTDHLSIPCSLATEAHEIAVLLNKEWGEEEFPVFFRFYLVALSEFVRN